MKALLPILYFTFIFSICKAQDLAFESTKNVHPKLTFNGNTFFKSKAKSGPLSSLVTSRPTSDQLFIDFVGKGDIQKSISEGSDLEANTGVGIIFERHRKVESWFQGFELETTINIATTADTIESSFSGTSLQNRRDYGTYVLNPISTKQAFYANALLYFGYPSKALAKAKKAARDELDKEVKEVLEKDKANNASDRELNAAMAAYTAANEDQLSTFGKIASVISGANIRIITSNSVWKFKDTAVHLGVLALRIGVFHEFLPDNIRFNDDGRTEYSLFAGIHYTYRGIFGDLANTNNIGVKNQILGTTQKSYKGLEINFGFRLKNIRAEFQMPFLKGKDAPVDGLTDTQFLFSIKFIGGFGLKLNVD
jgi:hypothetical protein